VRHLDRGVGGDRPASEDSGEPPPPPLQRPQECRSPLRADVGERIEHGARIAGLAHLQHDLTELHPRPGLQRLRREAGQRQVLAQLAGRNRPAFRPQIGQNLRAEEEHRLVGIPVRRLRSPPVEIPLDALGCNREVRHGSLGEPASPALPGLEMQLDNMAAHGVLAHGVLRRLRQTIHGVVPPFQRSTRCQTRTPNASAPNPLRTAWSRPQRASSAAASAERRSRPGS